MRRKHHQREPLSYLTLGLIAVTASLGVYFFGFAPTTFRVAAPPVGSEVADFLNAVSVALERDKAMVRLQIVPHENDEAIAQAIDSGKVDLATVRADRTLPASSLGVAELQRFVALVLTRPSTGIKKVGELGGKKVGELTGAAAGTSVFSQLLASHQLGATKIERISIDSLDDIGSAFAEKRLDALLVSLPRGGVATAKLLNALTRTFGKPPLVLSIAEAKTIAAGNMAFTATEIKPGELGGTPALPTATIETLTFPELLVARRQLSESAVKELAKQLFAVRQSLTTSYPAAGRVAALDTTRGGSFSVHPGAAAFYDADEVAFVDRYSNIFWLVLFGFSTVVSAAVWLRRRLSPTQRESVRSNHAELMTLIEEVRTTEDPAILDAAEKRIDEIVAELSLLAFNGDMDPEERPAFDLAIGRIDKIIDTRRSTYAARQRDS